MILPRRSFISGLAAALAAPAVVRAANIMPVRTPVLLRDAVLRHISVYDVTQDQLITRLDVRYGYFTVRAGWIDCLGPEEEYNAAVARSAALEADRRAMPSQALHERARLLAGRANPAAFERIQRAALNLVRDGAVDLRLLGMEPPVL